MARDQIISVTKAKRTRRLLLSHSDDDFAFVAERMTSDLEGRGHSVWHKPAPISSDGALSPDVDAGFQHPQAAR